MSVRDLLILALVAWGCVLALRKPWIGIMLWTWLSIMNPHRYAWGWAYEAPVAAMAAAATFVGLLLTSERRDNPFKSSAAIVFFAFMCWMTLSWLLGLDREGDYEQWNKVMKIDLMVLIGLVVLHSKKHILALAWVSAGSLMLLGVKGGVFMILSGGGQRVWGPPGSFIQDNNEFGLALIMAIPLLRFLQLQLNNRWARLAMTLAMLLCTAAVFGTYSRGAFLAICAMGFLYWLRSKGNKFVSAVVIVTTAVVMLSVMPEHWSERMSTIETYQDDGSAQGRLAAWSAAWGSAFHYPFGIGFNPVRQEIFVLYSHNPGAGARAAHSIYFQVLGNHGFIGLGLFMLIWAITWRQAGWLRKEAAKIPQAQWCADLGAMVQVSLFGYFAGGAFLSLSYFDLPYIIMSLVILATVWVRQRAWEREPEPGRGWNWVPGLATRQPVS